jgi:predicted transcriptional regulator
MDIERIMEQVEEKAADFTELTAYIVSSYVSHNVVHRSDLAALIASVDGTLRGLGASKQPEPEKQQPAISVRKSITPDFLVSLEDGKQYKSLKRHLTRLGLTPAEYREKWGLPRDYPMVAPNYAQRRSELAKSLGLGSRRKQEPSAKAAAASQDDTVSEAPEGGKSKRRAPAKRKAAK